MMYKTAKYAFLLVLCVLFVSLHSRNVIPSSNDYFSSPKPKRILLIIMDGARYDYCTPETMPNLFSFMKEGLLFKNAYSTSSWTLPSHASLFTGLYPQQHGVFRLPYKPTNDIFTDRKRRLETEVDIDNISVSAKAKKTASYARGYFLKLFQLETYRKLFRGAISFKGVYRTLFGHISKNEVSSDRILKDTKRDVLKGIAEFKGMILHIYASADPECEPSRRYFEKFYANNSVAARFITVEEANHNFYSIRSREEVYKATVKILDAVI